LNVAESVACGAPVIDAIVRFESEPVSKPPAPFGG